MKDYDLRYQKIVGELIGKSFPELKDRKIRIFSLNSQKLYGLCVPFYGIGIGRKSENLSFNELKALIAHELGHVKYSYDYGFIKSYLLFFAYWFNGKLRINEEIKVDKLVIRKGYARGLALLSARLEKEFPDCKDRTYMSIGKIKRYAKETRKW